MRISSLELRNYKVFEDFQIGFHPRLTVLAGLNGCGKSTVLEAVYNSQCAAGKMPKVQPHLKFNEETGEARNAFPASAYAAFNDPFFAISWTKRNETDTGQIIATPSSDDSVKMPPILLLEMISAPQFDMPSAGKSVSAMKNIANRFISRFGFSVTNVAGPESIVVRDENDGEIDLALLGGGIQNIVRLGLALASATVSDNQKHGREIDTPAPIIACIDNIELHLHPSWQQLLITSLLRAFPEAQFIVSTHSSFILSTVRAKSIRTIERDADGLLRAVTPHREVIGTNADAVLASVLKTSPTPDTPQRRTINRLIELIESGEEESDEANELFSWLVDYYGEHHPVVIDIERRIRFQKLKQRVPSSAYRAMTDTQGAS